MSETILKGPTAIAFEDENLHIISVILYQVYLQALFRQGYSLPS